MKKIEWVVSSKPIWTERQAKRIVRGHRKAGRVAIMFTHKGKYGVKLKKEML